MEPIKLNNKEVFVIHVKEGYKDREQHINSMLKAMDIPFNYILDGDVSDLTSSILDKYFKGYLKEGGAPASCTYKHILACRYIIERKLDGALILEDDIILNEQKFNSTFNKTIEELAQLPNEASIISYEDTRLRFVPKSRRIKNKMLYIGDRDRMAGAYYVNFKCAQTIINEIEKNKTDMPCDIFYNYLLKQNKIKYYWCQPTVATQGSHLGLFGSSINTNKKCIDIFLWKFKLIYKKLLYEFR